MRDRLVRWLLMRHPEMAVGYWSGDLKGAVRKFGPDSAQALFPRQERAVALFHAGHQEEAEAEFAAVIAAWEARADGGNEAWLDLARQWHARALYDLKRYAEAEPELAALAARSQSRGDDDLARDARRWLAHSLYHLGRIEEAEAEYRIVADEDARVLGPGHPDTVRHRQSHAKLLAEMERYDEAEKTMAWVIGRRAEDGETGSAAMLEARKVHAAVLHELGLQEARTGNPQERYAAAEAELSRVIAARAAAGEADSAVLLNIRGQRAVILDDMGRLEESQTEWRALAEEYRRLHGPGHPDTLLMRLRRADALRNMGLRGRAAAEYGAVARQRAKTLGPDHPDTQLAREWQDRLLRRRKPRPDGSYPVDLPPSS